MKASAGSAVATHANSTEHSSPAVNAADSGSAAARTADPKPAVKLAQKADMNQDNAPTEETAGKKPQPVAKVAKPEAKAAAPATGPVAATPAARPGLVAPAVAAVTASASATPSGPMNNDRRPPDRGPAPRAHAKAETFVEGDHVVYPTHGVGKVERIATEEIAGHRLELIHITFEENRMTLRVPVAKARSAGLRKLATRKMFDEALAVLKGRARIKRTMWSRRAQEYEAKINSGDPLAIAEVVRDLHRNAGQPDQSFSERQIYEAAMDRLAAELAALDKTDKATASEKLTNFLKTIA
jgi:CarD family transcriptional regulator